MCCTACCIVLLSCSFSYFNFDASSDCSAYSHLFSSMFCLMVDTSIYPWNSSFHWERSYDLIFGMTISWLHEIVLVFEHHWWGYPESFSDYQMRIYIELSVFSCSGSKIFSTFIGFLKSKDPSDGTEQALLDELSSFNDYIKENVRPLSGSLNVLRFVYLLHNQFILFSLKGPFINGEKISAADLSLAPKLYHLEIALGHYKKWSIPDTLPYTKSYMKVHHLSCSGYLFVSRTRTTWKVDIRTNRWQLLTRAKSWFLAPECMCVCWIYDLDRIIFSFADDFLDGFVHENTC